MTEYNSFLFVCFVFHLSDRHCIQLHTCGWFYRRRRKKHYFRHVRVLETWLFFQTSDFVQIYLCGYSYARIYLSQIRLVCQTHTGLQACVAHICLYHTSTITCTIRIYKRDISEYWNIRIDISSQSMFYCHLFLFMSTQILHFRLCVQCSSFFRTYKEDNDGNVSVLSFPQIFSFICSVFFFLFLTISFKEIVPSSNILNECRQFLSYE